MDLFSHGRQGQIESESPLANRMRPRTLDEFVGQAHIVGPGRLLRGGAAPGNPGTQRRESGGVHP